MTATNRGRALGPDWVLLPVMAYGPAVTVACVLAWLRGPSGLPEATHLYVLGPAVLFWLPFTPVGAPALWLQDVRDRALPQVPRARRAVRLVAWLACSPASPVRLHTWVNLAGVAGALVLAARL